MSTRTRCTFAVFVAVMFFACGKHADVPGAGSAGLGGSSQAGASGALGSAGKAAGAGGNTASGAGGATAGHAGAAGGGACNLACVKGKHCELKPTPTCVDDGGTLHWFPSCGAPVCQGTGNFDDPNIANCTTQREAQPCAMEGERCDGVLGCGATLICATQAPTTCPRSRAVYKQDIRYLDAAERAQYHDQITQLMLATYRYKTAPDVPQLGFMIDDVEPSVAVHGDQVNLYAYLSMAVAAIQVQDQHIKALEQQLEQVRAQLGEPALAVCAPANPR